MSSKVPERSRADIVRFRSESKLLPGDSVFVPREVSSVVLKQYHPREETDEQDYIGDAFRANFLPLAPKASAWITHVTEANAAQKVWVTDVWATNVSARVVSGNMTLALGPPTRQGYGEVQAELDRVKDVAAEEGLPEPADELVKEAGTVLRWMYRELPYAYDATPEDDGGIGLHAMHDEISVWIILPREGPVTCFVNMDGESRRASFTERSKVCGTFLKGALQDLRRCGM